MDTATYPRHCISRANKIGFVNRKTGNHAGYHGSHFNANSLAASSLDCFGLRAGSRLHLRAEAI